VPVQSPSPHALHNIGINRAAHSETHVGSLPRGNDLVPLLLARDQGRPYDAAGFDRIVEAAVVDAIDKQEASGCPSSAMVSWARWAIRPI